MQKKDPAIKTIREFNRFYTSIIGLLDKHILDSRYSLSEARIMFEISRMKQCTAREIRDITHMDEGYLSRIVDKFLRLGLISKTRSEEDGRAHFLSLTRAGAAEFATLDHASHRDVEKLIDKLTEEETSRLTALLGDVKAILSKTL